tara:strand:+ start:732 stop:1109 length:378 start_codon:yes stop_codon:yes gene_type:complete
MSKNILDKAKTHFMDVMSGELQDFYIEEWDTTFYYKKGSNFKAESKVLELQNAGKTGEALVQMIINRCLDKEGKKVFSDHQKAELMNSVDPNVLVKIVNAMNDLNDDDDAMTPEKARKNSKPVTS